MVDSVPREAMRSLVLLGVFRQYAHGVAGWMGGRADQPSE